MSSEWYDLNEQGEVVPIPGGFDGMLAELKAGKRKDGYAARAFHLVETVGDTRVSTVFLGLDHRFEDGPPVVFETMCFGGSLEGNEERYSTKAEAEAGHARWVQKARESVR